MIIFTSFFPHSWVSDLFLAKVFNSLRACVLYLAVLMGLSCELICVYMYSEEGLVLFILVCLVALVDCTLDDGCKPLPSGDPRGRARLADFLQSQTSKDIGLAWKWEIVRYT